MTLQGTVVFSHSQASCFSGWIDRLWHCSAKLTLATSSFLSLFHIQFPLGRMKIWPPGHLNPLYFVTLFLSLLRMTANTTTHRLMDASPQELWVIFRPFLFSTPINEILFFTVWSPQDFHYSCINGGQSYWFRFTSYLHYWTAAMSVLWVYVKWAASICHSSNLPLCLVRLLFRHFTWLVMWKKEHLHWCPLPALIAFIVPRGTFNTHWSFSMHKCSL